MMKRVCIAAATVLVLGVGATAAAEVPLAYDDNGCLGPGCAGGLVDGEFEYVVVGAGAGGGPLAARLAASGHSVLVLEAGGDTGDRLTYQIPAWHALASEDGAMRWDYFVSHFDDPAQAARDDKLVRNADGTPRGIWYPRGSGLGGSTTVNAMITVAPSARDWDQIADQLGDEDPLGSWRAGEMRRYFERIENNGYLPVGTSGHGFSGWMPTSAYLDKFFDFLMGATDWKMLRVIAATILQTGHELGAAPLFGDLAHVLDYLAGDLNSNAPDRDGREGAFRLPQESLGGRRYGVRELLRATIAAGHPLTVQTHALATGVTFDRSGPTPRATGVQWLAGADQYAAAPRASAAATGVPRSIRVTREVILSAGAFNTPQLLLLSGIGPRAQLAQYGIDPVVDLPGVGANLQDRYELAVTGEMSSTLLGDEFQLLKNCSFDPTLSPAQLAASDPCYGLWQKDAGVYTINGSVVGVVRRSQPTVADPDLFIFGLPGYFKGYYPGYSAQAIAKRTQFTWVVLKARTGNNRGSVALASADPRQRPDIHFRYFADGDADLQALVDGVMDARRIADETRQLSPLGDGFREIYPGPAVASRQQLTDFVRDHAWGHHACCTARIGRGDDPLAVLDGNFRVRGTSGLRVVDASVFPRIPGFFLALPIYMASEKAADVILSDAR
jgi:choline dehydrogenase